MPLCLPKGWHLTTLRTSTRSPTSSTLPLHCRDLAVWQVGVHTLMQVFTYLSINPNKCLAPPTTAWTVSSKGLWGHLCVSCWAYEWTYEWSIYILGHYSASQEMSGVAFKSTELACQCIVVSSLWLSVVYHSNCTYFLFMAPLWLLCLT